MLLITRARLGHRSREMGFAMTGWWMRFDVAKRRAAALVAALLVAATAPSFAPAVAQAAGPGHVTGVVTGPDGRGLGNVIVSVYTRTPFESALGHSVHTNADGVYDLPVEPGSYVIGFGDDVPGVCVGVLG